MKRKVKIQILGKDYSLVCNASNEDIEHVTKCVQDKIDEARRLSKTNSMQDIAILSALNLAHDHIAAERKHRAFKEKTLKKVKGVFQKLENITPETESNPSLM